MGQSPESRIPAHGHSHLALTLTRQQLPTEREQIIKQIISDLAAQLKTTMSARGAGLTDITKITSLITTAVVTQQK